MDVPDSTELLREFSVTGSEAAFGEVVRRHLDLVYSAALRRCGGDGATARDIAQVVFSDLVRHARSPQRGGLGSALLARSLPAWLHQHTCFVAAHTVRTEVRRRAREETAQQVQSQEFDVDWSHVAPELETVLAELPEADRSALVLRFFDQASFARVGSALGTSEDAARMRVERALGKLRDHLAKRGVTSTAAALGASLTVHGITSAPTGMANSIITTALALPAQFGVASLLTFKPLTVGISVAVAVASLWVTFQSGRASRTKIGALEAERQGMARELAQVQMELATLQKRVPTADQLAQFAADRAELLRLRGETARLRRELAEVIVAPTPGNPAELATTAEVASILQVHIDAKFIDLAETDVPIFTDLSDNGTTLLTEIKAAALLETAAQRPGVNLLSSPQVTTLSGRSAEVSVMPSEGLEPGLTLEILPEVLSGGRQHSLILRMGYAFPQSPDEDTPLPAATLPPESFTQILVPDGQSVLFRKAAISQTNGPRSLLVLVTPISIDSTGQRLFPTEPPERGPVETAAPITRTEVPTQP